MKTYIYLLFYCISPLLIGQDFYQYAQLTSQNLPENIYFGYAIDVENDIAVVGANEVLSTTAWFYETHGGFVIYKKHENSYWYHEDEFVIEGDVSYGFGSAVAILNETILVGQPSYGGAELSPGAVREYVKDDTGNWISNQIIRSSDVAEGDYFGAEIEMHGNYALVSAYRKSLVMEDNVTYPFSGAVYLFEKNVNGDWVEIQKLLPSVPTAYSYFGKALYMDEDHIIIGAPLKKISNETEEIVGAGVSYVFQKNEAGVWTETQIITATNPSEKAYFGIDIAKDDTQILISASRDQNTYNDVLIKSGAVYSFELNDDNIWTEQQKITPENALEEEYFGTDISLSNNKILISASGNDTNVDNEEFIENSGSSYLYERADNGDWSMIQKITAQEREEDHSFGMCNFLVDNDLFVSSNVEQVHVFTNVTLATNSQENKALSLHPNPVQNTVQIVLAAPIYNAQFKLYDLYGNLVQQSNLLEGSTLNIDIAVPTGVFVFELVGDNNYRSTHKIIVE